MPASKKKYKKSSRRGDRCWKCNSTKIVSKIGSTGYTCISCGFETNTSLQEIVYDYSVSNRVKRIVKSQKKKQLKRKLDRAKATFTETNR